MGTSIGTVTAILEANTKTFDTSLQSSTNQLRAAQFAAEKAGTAISVAGEKIDRTALLQERAADRARAAWQRELLQQEKATLAEAATARSKEIAALKTDILTRATENEAKAQARLNLLLGTGRTALQGVQTIGVGIGFGLAVAGLKRMIESTIEAGVELGRLHEQTGVSMEDLSVLKFAAAETGTSFETLTRGFRRLAVTVSDAERGVKVAKLGFQDLGISTEDLKAKGNDMYGVLQLIADKFEQMPDGIGKSDAAAKIFGVRMGSEMIPVLNQGAAALENFKSKAPIITDHDLEQLEKAHKATVNLSAAWQKFSMNLTVAVAPAMSTFFNWLATGIEKNEAELAHLGESWKALGRTVLLAGQGLFGAAYLSAQGIMPPVAAAPAASSAPKAGGVGPGGGSVRGIEGALATADFTNYWSGYFRAAAAAGAPSKLPAGAWNWAAQYGAPAPGAAAMPGYNPMALGLNFGASAKVIGPSAGPFDAFLKTLKDTADEFTNLNQVLSSFTIGTLNKFNETLMKVLSTPDSMLRGQHPWRQLGASTAQSAGSAALKYGEGMAMSELGKIPGIGKLFKSTHKPTGSQSDPLWVKLVDGGAGSTSSSMGGGDSISSSFLGGGGSGGAGSAMGAGGAGAIGALFGGGASEGSGATASMGKGAAEGFAEGGMIPSNMPSLVGEKGPELFMPRTSGRIIPNGSFGGGQTVNNYFDNRGNSDPAASEAAMHRVVRSYLPHISGMATNAIRDSNRRRPLSKAR